MADKAKKGGKKGAKEEGSKADERKKSEKVEEPKPVEAGEAAQVAAEPAEKAKKGKKTSERKQSTKEEPVKKAEEPKAAETTEPAKAEEVKIHTGKKFKVLGISGSLRKGSYNTALLRAAQKLAPEDLEITIADISGLPHFNEDHEYEPIPAVTAFKKQIEEADAIIFACAEYNYGLSGVLKNAIDVASRPWGQNSFSKKHAAVISASIGGFGGLRAQLSLRQTALFLKLNMFLEEFLVSLAQDQIKEGELSPELTAKYKDWLALFAKWVRVEDVAKQMHLGI